MPRHKDKKMASQRQLEANRANAKYSTGPKTHRGKARSKKNAITHGLTAKEIVVGGEKPAEFDAFRASLFSNFSVTLERELVDLLAGLLFRLRRVPVVEAVLLKDLGRRDLESGVQQLTDEELDQLVTLSGKMLNIHTPPHLTDLAEQEEAREVRRGGQPRNLEMLTIFARYQSSLINDVIKIMNYCMLSMRREEPTAMHN
jgi:hypothetical protein